MSQPAKRTVEDAFDGQQGEPRTKRQRRKHRKSNIKNTGVPTTPKDDDRTAHTDSKSNSPDLARQSTPKISENVDQAGGVVRDNRDVASMTKGEEATNHPTLDPEHTTTTASKKKKKRQKKSNSAQMQLAISSDQDATKKEKEGLHKNTGKKGPNNSGTEQSLWTASHCSGGRFINNDPILTTDSKFLILLTKSNVQVYSTATSLLVRSIYVTSHSELRSAVLSTANENHIFVGTKNGSLIKYDWTIGRKLSQWKAGAGILHLSWVAHERTTDHLAAITLDNDGFANLATLAVETKSSRVITRRLLQQDFLHTHICLSADRSIITVFGRDRIHIGSLSSKDSHDLLDLQYVWKVVETKGRITSCDTRFTKKDLRGQAELDVVVGLQNGAITTYYDLLSHSASESRTTTKSQRQSRRLHWHRSAVKSVKWSRDGNYLISGGDESVLVLWQLDTNQKQFLPHLSTSILNISVSQSGAHYAMRLGDNSAMVLATADLSPSANISGLLISPQDVVAHTTFLHPVRSSQLMSAVSTRVFGSRATDEATHLQIYDIDANIQLARQALTRNFTTAVNISPEGQPLHEPSVTQLCISKDGKWLATVDEWSPSEFDLDSLYLESDQKGLFKEVVLRFWICRDGGVGWDASTRIEEPHARELSVLAMAANPIKTEFATIASDGCVKTWTPKARSRSGVSVKDAAGEVLYTWSSALTVQVENHVQTVSEADTMSGALSYSEDGSAIAVVWPSKPHSNNVYLIDSQSGATILAQPNLSAGTRTQIRFCGRYLVILSDIFTIFDTITLQTVFSLALDEQFRAEPDSLSHMLAVSPLSNTAAIAINYLDHSKPRCLISVFDLKSPATGSITELQVSGFIRTLLDDPSGRGFVILDADAGVQRLTASGSTGGVSLDLVVPQKEAELGASNMLKGINDVFGSHAASTKVETSQRLLESSHDIAGQNLDTLLGPNSSLSRLGINDIFERVAQAASGVRASA